MICINTKVNTFLLQHLHRSPISSFWNGAFENDGERPDEVWVMIGFKSLDLKYYGIITAMEEDERFPQIRLSAYTKGAYEQNLFTEFQEDHTGDLNKYVILDTAKADFVEFIIPEETK